MTLQIVKPKIRGFICTNAHPIGCEFNVKKQIKVAKLKRCENTNKKLNVLVIGASTGYGLASRIALSTIHGANTIGVFYERIATENHTGTAGFYNSMAFNKFARSEGLFSGNINGDAFSDEIKQETIEVIKRNFSKIDFVIYSLASPRRTHPRTGITSKSVLKPIGESYKSKTLELDSEKIIDIELEPATSQEIADTVSVMGGEDLEFWIDALMANKLLAENAKVLAYSYIGPELARKIYSDGTIGEAKKDLEHCIDKIDRKLQETIGGNAYLSVNKAVVTQASAAIPVVPLYLCILKKVMKAKNIDESPIDQMVRLFTEQIAPDRTPELDSRRRIRLDNYELRSDIYAEITEIWSKIDSENFRDLSAFEAYRYEFRNLFGFEFEEIDYELAVDICPTNKMI